MSVRFDKLILGSLIMRPGLLESSDIGDGDFPDGLDSKIFRAITEEWENGRPGTIDINVLTAKIEGDGAYIGGLLDGLVKLDDQTFCRYLREHRKRLAGRRLAQALKKNWMLNKKRASSIPNLSGAPGQPTICWKPVTSRPTSSHYQRLTPSR